MERLPAATTTSEHTTWMASKAQRSNLQPASPRHTRGTQQSLSFALFNRRVGVQKSHGYCGWRPQGQEIGSPPYTQTIKCMRMKNLLSKSATSRIYNPPLDGEGFSPLVFFPTSHRNSLSSLPPPGKQK